MPLVGIVLVDICVHDVPPFVLLHVSPTASLQIKFCELVAAIAVMVPPSFEEGVVIPAHVTPESVETPNPPPPAGKPPNEPNTVVVDIEA